MVHGDERPAGGIRARGRRGGGGGIEGALELREVAGKGGGGADEKGGRLQGPGGEGGDEAGGVEGVLLVVGGGGTGGGGGGRWGKGEVEEVGSDEGEGIVEGAQRKEVVGVELALLHHAAAGAALGDAAAGGGGGAPPRRAAAVGAPHAHHPPLPLEPESNPWLALLRPALYKFA